MLISTLTLSATLLLVVPFAASSLINRVNPTGVRLSPTYHEATIPSTDEFYHRGSGRCDMPNCG